MVSVANLSHLFIPVKPGFQGRVPPGFSTAAMDTLICLVWLEYHWVRLVNAEIRLLKANRSGLRCGIAVLLGCVKRTDSNREAGAESSFSGGRGPDFARRGGPVRFTDP